MTEYGTNGSRRDDSDKKIFVGGLSWETTNEELKEYFAKFGDITDCTLKTDPTTGRSRGFGFITFATSDDVNKIVSQESHTLNGRNIDPKRAKARGGSEPVKKVFVGGLDPETSEEEVRSYFGQYGTIAELNLPFDKIKGQRRAFCFITFDTDTEADDCCRMAKHTVGAKEVDVKKATPKTQDGGGFGRGGRGGFQSGGRGFQPGGRGRGYGDSQGYDYSNQGYGGYDYNAYPAYDNSYSQGWAGYDQGQTAGYGSSYGDASQGNSYGKARSGMRGSGGNRGYQPY